MMRRIGPLFNESHRSNAVVRAMAGILLLGAAGAVVSGNATAAPAAGGLDPGLLVLRGIGAEGRKPYRGPGKVRFIDVRAPFAVIHFQDKKTVPLHLEIEYEVVEPAPVVLTSRLGTENWQFVRCSDGEILRAYTDERIDLAQPGRRVARSTRATAASRYGPEFSKGMYQVCGHGYFLIDPPKGTQWLDVVRPPAFFNLPGLSRRVIFTLADLRRHALEIRDVQSTWKPHGVFRVRMVVRDATGKRLPVVAGTAELRFGKHSLPLQPQFDPLNVPTGWLWTRLPGTVPEQVRVRAEVPLLLPGGKTAKEVVERVFRRGEGTAPAAEIAPAGGLERLSRTTDGKIRETRALWAAPSDLTTRADIRNLVDRAARAGLNVIIPDVFVRSQFLAKSPLFPMSKRGLEAGLDPLGFLIQTAHARGIEVHPWFCVTYRDAAFRKTLPGVDIIDRNGKVVSLGADVHRPEYRKFIVGLMVGVARDYPVDGIHLDYIRVMHDCWCPKCRAEFLQRFGKPMEQATDEDWVAWHRSAVGTIVRETAEGVRAVRPHAVMSAAVFANMKGGARQGQDPAGWARQGWLDVVIPMDYAMQTLVVRNNERRFLAALHDDDCLVTGLSLYQRVGGKVFPRPPELVADQVRLVRAMGIHGYCLFASPYLDDAIIGKLRKDVNGGVPAVPYFRLPDGRVRRPAGVK